MQQYDFTASANKPFFVGAAGRYIKYVSGSNGGGDASLLITPGGMGGNKITLQPGQAYRIADDAKVPDSWTLLNAAGGAPILGRIVVGNGRIDDPTISGTVQVVDGGKARTLGGGAFTGYGALGALANNITMIQLLNPAGSGKRVVIEQLIATLLAVNTTTVANLRLGVYSSALTNLTATPTNKLIGSGIASIAQIRNQQAAATLLGGGMLWEEYVAGGVVANYVPHEPIVLGPGTGVLVDSGLVNAGISATFEWYEEPNT